MTVTAGLESYLRERLAKKPTLLMTHLVVGYPSLDANWAMLEAMEEAGVDLVELQLPFSEPIADGPAFVKANHEAIRAGTTWRDYFDLAARGGAVQFAIVFMGYYNSVFRMGAERFCARLSDAGMRGFILPDLPPEAGAELNAVARGRELDPILIMTPTSSSARLAEIGRQASGFIYCAARTGVTGKKTDLSSQGVAAFMERCRAASSLPLGLGFGIKTESDVRQVRGLADMAIVGTAGLAAWEQLGPDGYRQYLKTLVPETA